MYSRYRFLPFAAIAALAFLSMLLLSTARGGPVGKGVGLGVQVPTPVIKGPKGGVGLHIVSASVAQGQGLLRDRKIDLSLTVVVRNDSSRSQAFYLKADMGWISGVNTSPRLTISPQKTLPFNYVLRKINPGARTGNFSGAVMLLDAAQQTIGKSSPFVFHISDPRPAEALKITKVEVLPVEFTPYEHRAVFKRVHVQVTIANVGREIWAKQSRLRIIIGYDNWTDIRSHDHERRVFIDLPPGIGPGEVIKRTGKLTSRYGYHGTGPGLWQKIFVDIYEGSHDLCVDGVTYRFMVYDSGRLRSSSRVNRPRSRNRGGTGYPEWVCR